VQSQHCAPGLFGSYHSGAQTSSLTLCHREICAQELGTERSNRYMKVRYGRCRSLKLQLSEWEGPEIRSNLEGPTHIAQPICLDRVSDVPTQSVLNYRYSVSVTCEICTTLKIVYFCLICLPHNMCTWLLTSSVRHYTCCGHRIYVIIPSLDTSALPRTEGVPDDANC
jgi:hypothetical protein